MRTTAPFGSSIAELHNMGLDDPIPKLDLGELAPSPSCETAVLLRLPLLEERVEA